MLSEDEKKEILKRLTPEWLENVKVPASCNIEIEKTQEEIDAERIELGIIYEEIISILKRYCDIEERYYSLISLWIIGTYMHKEFPSYPYLFFNAMKGSGKSRLLRLITTLAKDGCMLNSLTEAVMFRTTGTLGIDEFEGLNRKGKEALTELLNSAYKKGTTVKRMKKVKTIAGEEQQVEEFDVYRPIVIANISGMDNVLNDRCITIILERSSNPAITKIVERFEKDDDINHIKSNLQGKGVVSVGVDLLYNVWNKYIINIYTNYTTTTIPRSTLTAPNKILEKYLSFFNKIDKSGIDGRSFELAAPLLIIANYFNEDITNCLLKTLKEIIDEKKKDDVVENLDISLIDFLSEEKDIEHWKSIKDLFQEFQNSIRLEEDWFNEKWMGRALKRLGLIKEKKRMRYGMIVKLDYLKSQEKIRMFK